MIMDKKIVLIKWFDSCKSGDWILLEDLDENIILCISVGFPIKETTTFVCITQNFGFKLTQVCHE